MFFNRLYRCVRKLFDKEEVKVSQVVAKSGPDPELDLANQSFDGSPPPTSHLSVECRQSSSEVVSEDLTEETNYETIDSKTTRLSIESLSIKHLEDWNQSNDCSQIPDWCEEPYRSRIETSMSSNNRQSAEKKRQLRSKDSNRLLEKWGESVGIFDESGAQKRLLCLSALRNFFVLNLSSLNCSDCLILCALINSRYPRFYTSTVNYLQRWRMRYNIFVASDALICRQEQDPEDKQKVLIRSQSSLSEVPDDQLVLHIGELHLYFDVVPKFVQPVYVNSSFYANRSAINEMPGVTINPIVMTRITRIVNSIRYSKDIFRFKFPLDEKMFRRTDQTFDKFVERQTELIDETIKVYRKSGQKKRRFQNWSQPQPKPKYRDYFAYDYDTKHFESRDCGRCSPLSVQLSQQSADQTPTEWNEIN